MRQSFLPGRAEPGREQRGEQEDGICPSDLLEHPDVQLLNFWLSRFVVEARREDGKPYPASTIQNIMAGLYRYSKNMAPSGTVVPNFMNTRNSIFRDLMLIIIG